MKQTGVAMQAATGKGGKKAKKSSSNSSKEIDDVDVLLAEAVKENSTCFFTKYVQIAANKLEYLVRHSQICHITEK